MRTVAAPIPREPPVIRATFPESGRFMPVVSWFRHTSRKSGEDRHSGGVHLSLGERGHAGDRWMAVMGFLRTCMIRDDRPQQAPLFHDHSCRSATMGSIFAARCAGM